jgi:hypothetical protein
MTSRSLARRLERLEEQTMPIDEPKVWQIVLVDSDGTQTLGQRIEWSARRRRPEAKAPQPWRRLR